jgi:hypothetical protein
MRLARVENDGEWMHGQEIHECAEHEAQWTEPSYRQCRIDGVSPADGGAQAAFDCIGAAVVEIHFEADARAALSKSGRITRASASIRSIRA